MAKLKDINLNTEEGKLQYIQLNTTLRQIEEERLHGDMIRARKDLDQNMDAPTPFFYHRSSTM